MADAKKAKFLEVAIRSNEVELTFGNGEKRVVKYDDMPEHIKLDAMRLGFSNKFRDTAANHSKTNDYAGATDSMDAVIQSLKDGEWKRAGGGQSGQLMKDLARAIGEIKKVSVERAMEAVEKADKDKRAAWAKSPAIALLIAKYVQERLEEAAAKAEGGTDDLPTFEDAEEIEIDGEEDNG